jgi:hypothetical protein
MKVSRGEAKGRDMQGLEFTWKRVVAVWWLLTWRGGLGSMLLAVAGGAADGAISGARGAPSIPLTWTLNIITGVLGLIWMVFVVRMALRKRYSDFRLAAVSD